MYMYIFKDLFSDPNLEHLCVWQLDSDSFCENYTKLYFDAKHLKRDEIRGVKFLVPFLINIRCYLDFLD